MCGIRNGSRSRHPTYRYDLHFYINFSLDLAIGGKSVLVKLYLFYRRVLKIMWLVL